MDEATLVQVPKYELHVVDDGVTERVELSVKLPGVLTAADITVKCCSGSSSSSTGSISVSVPGRYNLQLVLPVNIPERAESVKYIKKKETLKVICPVVPPATAASMNGTANGPSASEGHSSSSSSSANVGTAPPAAPAAAAAAVHESFLPPPTKAERRRQQEAAAAAAAAEAERRRQAESAAAAAAARAAAAAQEEQRRQQQQRANREAAEAWLQRGLDAAQQNNIDLASKALKKMNELGSGVDITPLRQALVQLRQQQQKQQPQQNSQPASSSSTQKEHQQQPCSNQDSSSSSGSGSKPTQQQQQQRPNSRTGSNNSSSSGSSRGPGGARRGQPAPKPTPATAASDTPAAAAAAAAAASATEDAAAGSSSSSSEGLVEWWCRHYDILSERLLDKAERLNDYAKEPGRSRAAYWSAVAGSLAIVGLHFVIIWCWRMGWTQPLYVAAYIRQLGGDSYAESRAWIGHTAQYLIQHTVAAAAVRAGLVGLSGFVVWLLLWVVVLMPLGSHSLVGWGVAAGWGLWKAMVWHPWHSIQLPLAVLLLVVFGVGGRFGAIAHWSLQMLCLGSMSCGGGLVNLSAWGLSWALYLGLIPKIPPPHYAAANAASVVICAAVSSILKLTLGQYWTRFAGLNPEAQRPWGWGGWLLLLLEWCLFAMFLVLRVMFWGKKWGREEWTYSSKSQEYEHDTNTFEPGHTRFVMGFGTVAVPEGCSVESVRTVLAAKNYYEVMGFATREECTIDSLKAARKKMALAVHPDKVGHDHPGANQAAGRVNKAFETLSSVEQRKAYDQLLDLHAQPRQQRAGSSQSGNGAYDYVPPYEDSLYDIDDNPAFMQDMPCGVCGRQHTVYVLPKAPFGVRWCRECSTWHTTQPNEVWAHWTPSLGGLMGRARILFAPEHDSPVYDITDMFKCSGKLAFNSSKTCNTHHNPIADAMAARGGKGSRKSQRAQQQQPAQQQHSGSGKKGKKGKRR